MTVLDDEQLAARAVEAAAYEEAIRLLQPLVERNSEYALLTLGWIWETGATGACDSKTAQLYYEHAAELGSASARLSLGRLLLEAGGEEAQARAAFEAGVQLGNEECKSALARLDDHCVERLARQAVEVKAYDEAARLLRPLVERNSEYALLALGWIQESGMTGAEDKNAARLYYEHAVALGSVSAYLSLGRLLSGMGEEAQARAMFEAGAQLGNDECKSALARLDDYHVERQAEKAVAAGDYDEAVRLLQPLAERNSEYVLLTLGWIHEAGAAGAADKNAARLYYERAVATGSVSAYLSLGGLLSGIGEEAQARAAFEAGNRVGSDECKSALARLDDDQVERLAHLAVEAEAYDEASRLLQPLAERNSVNALLTLGWIHETGSAGAADVDAAWSCYERAAAAGSAAAYSELGRLLLVKGEEFQARSKFQAGARLEDILCMSELGRMMVKGQGGPVEMADGVAWLERAAVQGHFFAQRTLLGIEYGRARTVLGKLRVAMKIASLAKKFSWTSWREPTSDSLR